jgi:arylsulfatase
MGYLRWYADNMWIFVPIQGVIQEFISTVPDYPFQEGSSLNTAGINYQSLKAAAVLKRLQESGTLSRPNN